MFQSYGTSDEIFSHKHVVCFLKFGVTDFLQTLPYFYHWCSKALFTVWHVSFLLGLYTGGAFVKLFVGMYLGATFVASFP